MTTSSNDPDDWALDEEWVRGGRHEPSARTRDAVARYGGERSSWRQPGAPAGEQRREGGRLRRRSSASRRAASRRWWQLPVAVQWLLGLVLVAGAGVLVYLLRT